VIVEYWLAGRFGRAWLWLHRSLEPKFGLLPGECTQVAHGNTLPAEQLWRTQDFAVRVWWRFGMAVFLLVFSVIGLGALLNPGPVGTDVGTSLIFGFGCVTGAALAQAGLIRYRSDRTRLYLIKSGPQGAGQPLPPGAPGLPRRFDFWIMLMLALIVFAILIYAATRSAHH
jgi:hypothetical protein